MTTNRITYSCHRLILVLMLESESGNEENKQQQQKKTLVFWCFILAIRICFDILFVIDAAPFATEVIMQRQSRCSFVY